VAGGADFHADVAFVRRLSLERVAAGANHVHRSISGMNSSFHFCGGDPFETFSIAKLETPVALSGTTGVASLGENLRLWLRKRQPVHRNLTPQLVAGVGYVWRLDFSSRPPPAVAYTFHLLWTTSFPSDKKIFARRNYKVNTVFHMLCRFRECPRYVVLRLQVARRETAHGEAIHQLERQPAGGVMAARSV